MAGDAMFEIVRTVRAALLASSCVSAVCGPADAATFVVDNTADSGAGSLRRAIQTANAVAGPDRIVFALTPAGPDVVHRIELASALPSITSPITLEGYSQAGSAASVSTTSFDGRVRVEIDGSALAPGADAFGFDIAGTGPVTIRGLSVVGFDASVGSAAVRLRASGFVALEGLLVGLAADGSPRANRLGIEVADAQTGDFRIGGGGPAQRNVISESRAFGVALRASSARGGLVQGNFIGVGFDGETARGNSVGVLVERREITLQHNLISGNDSTAVRINGGDRLQVLGNRIGVASGHDAGPGNGGSGIDTHGGAVVGAVIGGSGDEGNVIAHNRGDAGIALSANGNRVAILGNRIFDSAGLGIDLGTVGVLANDVGDADAGANGGQNFPVLLLARLDGEGGSDAVTLGGVLDSSPFAAYRLLFHGADVVDASGQGEAERSAIEQVEVFTDAAGTASFGPLRVVFGAGTAPAFVSATATRLDESGMAQETSEFSPAIAVQAIIPGEFVVTTAADAGPGSLRQAILDANAAPNTDGVADRVRFAIPGTAPHTLGLVTALPTVTDPVLIDGYTQPGARPNSLPAPGGFDGVPGATLVPPPGLSQDVLSVQTSDSVIRGLAFAGATQAGALRLGTVAAHERNAVEGCWFGITADGTLAPNRFSLQVRGRAARVGGAEAASRNVFAESSPTGTVSIDAPDAVIQGNLFGTRPNGVEVVFGGPRLALSASRHLVRDNVIGGAMFAGTLEPFVAAAVIVDQTGTEISLIDNLIGVAADGAALENDIGILIRGARVVIEGEVPIARARIGISDLAEDGMSEVLVAQPIARVSETGIRLQSPDSEQVLVLEPVDAGTGMAIDLGAAGPEIADAGDLDSGPNGLQNAPVLHEARVSADGGPVQVTGTLDSTPGTRFRIRFCQVGQTPSKSGRGGCSLQSATEVEVQTDASGHAGFEADLEQEFGSGLLTATASRVTGAGRESSSEYAISIGVASGPNLLFQDGFEP